MRVLVAGRNAKILAKAAGTFANDLQIHTAATKADCFALLRQIEFDLIVACETLADGSGLEVLSHVAVNTPNTLRIFAARPSTLVLLKSELGLFGLFRTLPYPINFRKLWAAISLARSTQVEEPAGPRVDQPPGPRVRHVVLDEQWVWAGPEANAGAGAVAGPRPPVTTAATKPTRAGAVANSRPPIATAATKPTRAGAVAGSQPQVAAAATRSATAPVRRQPQQAQQRLEITSGMRAAARYAAAHAPQASRIAESDAFKRAREKREATRREPVMSNESLAHLAKLATTSRPTHPFRGAPVGKNRAAFFVGSGVFAATTAAVLTFFLVNANNSMERSKLPLLASINRPIPHKAFPWQPATPQPTRQAAFMRSESSASTVADLDAEAEAASESFEGEPDHPGPPPPNAPPPPSEPPSLESSGQPVDE